MDYPGGWDTGSSIFRYKEEKEKMWIHIVIFAILLILWAGWKSGWIPAADFMDKEGKKLFFLLAVSGNILGLFLSLQSLDRTLPEGNRLIRTEDSYDQELMVSVDGKEQSRITVEIPGRIDVEEEDEQKQISEEEEERLQLLEMLERYNTEKGDEDYFWLPENWEGKNYEWQRPRDTKGSLLAALFLAAAAATLVLKGRGKLRPGAKTAGSAAAGLSRADHEIHLICPGGNDCAKHLWENGIGLQPEKAGRRSLCLRGAYHGGT